MTGKSLTDDRLGMTAAITRRDFVNGALVGAGVALTAGCGGAADASPEPFAPSGSPWTGYGGVGDYAWSNGNTDAVVKAAHGIRDALYRDAARDPVDETVDLVIVGGGFSGITAAYEFAKRLREGQTCLLLENHPMVGGEAKQNEFEVDGHRLTAPQGSNGGLIINDSYVRGGFDGGRYDVYADYYRELGLPSSFESQPLAGGAEKYKLPTYHYAPMALGYENRFETGYFFGGEAGWAKNPIRDGFRSTPWPEAVRREMDDFVNNRRYGLGDVANADAWLDTITYYDLCDKIGYGETARKFIDPYIAVANFGVAGSGISAYAAKLMRLPGTVEPGTQKGSRAESSDLRPDKTADFGVVSFPGGNAAILRAMLGRMIPGSVTGDGSIEAICSAPIDFATFDRPGAPLRLRTSATVIDVAHEGDPASAEHVIVTYVREGKIRKVRAKAVMMGSGGWVNRRVVSDMPDALAAAYGDFRYGPIMTANVAIRNWRFFDKLGITVARWFEGLGWHVCVRNQVVLGETRPLTPDDPIVLTFYIPFLHPDLPAGQQGAAGRQTLLATSYSDFERQIRTQMTAMFAAAGFDARRDIAGIVLNRWGHAYCAPMPGFFFGRDGAPPPYEVPKTPHGRIAFAHAELQRGTLNMAFSMMEAHRAMGQIMPML